MVSKPLPKTSSKEIPAASAPTPAASAPTPVAPPPVPVISPDTPYIIYLTRHQLDNILGILSTPSMLGGAEIVKRGILIETVQQSVPVSTYNKALLQRFVAEQKAVQDKEEAERLWAAREAEKQANPEAKPIIANTTATFKPHHVREAEAAAAAKAAEKKPVAKVATPAKKTPAKKPPVNKASAKATPKKVLVSSKPTTSSKKVSTPAKKATVKALPAKKKVSKHRW